MDLPSELWNHIASYLCIVDTCALVRSCKTHRDLSYFNSSWLDFTLNNLLRGIPIEEIIVIVFLKADQERLSKSRISTFKNYLKNYCAKNDIGNIKILIFFE
jgi:hypothetical protein